VTSAVSREDRVLLALRWTARLLAVVIVALALVFIIGEGGFNPKLLSPLEALQMALFLLACVAMLIAWQWELGGGLLSLAAMAGFMTVELAVNGALPQGVTLYLMFLPGLCYAVCGLIERRKRT
jgi:hypothetical protein